MAKDIQIKTGAENNLSRLKRAELALTDTKDQVWVGKGSSQRQRLLDDRDRTDLLSEIDFVDAKTSYFATPEQFGAKADGTDDSVAFQNAINSFNGRAGVLTLNGTKVYRIANTVLVPYNISIEGNFSKIHPLSGGELVDGFLFFINTTKLKVTIKEWGGDIIPNIQNLNFENPNSLENVKGFYTRGKTGFKSVTFTSFYKGILKEGTEDHDYTDMLLFEKVYFINCKGTTPLIDIRYSGDGLLLDRCHVAGTGNSNYNFLNLEFCNGGKITNCINGDITISKSIGISLENFHCEHGKILIRSSKVSLRDIFHWYHKEYQPILLTIINADNDKPSMACTINNYSVIHLKTRSELDKNYTTANYFDAYFKNANVKITNFFRRSTISADTSIGMETAIKTSIDGTTIWSEWENASQMYSKDSYLSGTKLFSSINEAVIRTNFVAYNPALVSFSGTFDAPFQAYHYQAIFYFGPTERAVARWGGGNKTVTLTGTNQIPLIDFQKRDEMQLSKIRLYRGDAAAQYTHYVDVPVGAGLVLLDYGFFLSTGERWITRIVGDVDLYNGSMTKIRMEGENVFCEGTAIPVQGTWKKGDRIMNTNIAVGQPQGWICSVEGSPGTWIALPNY